jgi:hypothetical protein
MLSVDAPSRTVAERVWEFMITISMMALVQTELESPNAIVLPTFAVEQPVRVSLFDAWPVVII